MVKTYDLLISSREEGGHCSVSLSPKAGVPGEDGDTLGV